MVFFVGFIFGSPVVTLRNMDFQNVQKTHQQNQLKLLRSAHQNLIELMTLVNNIFSKDGPEVCIEYFGVFYHKCLCTLTELLEMLS